MLRATHWASPGSALFLYDYLLTLPREVRYIWHAAPSTASALLVVNRYGTLLYRLLKLSQAVSWFGYTPATADFVSDRTPLLVC